MPLPPCRFANSSNAIAYCNNLEKLKIWFVFYRIPAKNYRYVPKQLKRQKLGTSFEVASTQVKNCVINFSQDLLIIENASDYLHVGLNCNHNFVRKLPINKLVNNFKLALISNNMANRAVSQCLHSVRLLHFLHFFLFPTGAVCNR